MRIDEHRARLAERFFRRLLRHTSDVWYGKPFVLTPWQREALREIFGRVDAAGRPLVRQAYIEIPKKTGKTEWAAGVALYVLVTARHPGCQVYLAASGLRQTANVFRAACKMVEQSAELRSVLRILRSTHRILRRDDPDSFIAAIAADGDLTDGVNPSCVIADEIHRWHTRKQLENWDVLALGGIARQHSLIVALTTAGTMDDSPLAWRYHEKTLKVAQGVISDPHFYGRRYGAEAGDDWEDERTWIKANPSLIENGGFLPIDKIRTAYLAAQSNPEDQRAFRRYYLNIWDQRDERAIDMKIWDECASGLKPPRWPMSERDMERLRSVPLYIGVDISLSTDLTAVVLLFLHEDTYEVVPFFWLPEDAVRKRELRDGVPYSSWAQEGFLETCPGSAIDPRLIRQRIEWAAERFDLREVCFDPYNSREISLMLQDAGIKCVEIRQTYSGVSEATKKLLHLVATRRLDHRDHPVLRWNASCLSLKSDGNDLIRPSKPDRERDSSRIDGISALIDALARAMLHEDKSVDVKVI